MIEDYKTTKELVKQFLEKLDKRFKSQSRKPLNQDYINPQA